MFISSANSKGADQSARSRRPMYDYVDHCINGVKARLSSSKDTRI